MNAITNTEIKTLADLGNLVEGVQTAMTTKHTELAARLLEAEQKLARRGPSPAVAFASDMQLAMTKAFEEATGLKDIQERRRGARASIDMPPGFFAKATPLLGAPALGQSERVTEIISAPKRKLTIRDLLKVVPTTAAIIEYVQATFTSGAAPVAEGATKPESTAVLVLKNAKVIVLAHWTKCSSQILSDFASLQAFIDNEMRFGLSLVEENQLLFGDGLGENLSGLATQAPIFTDATVGATSVDSIRRAKADLELAGFTATAIVLNPVDFAKAELIKLEDGSYLIGDPSGSSQPTMWGMPIVSSAGMTEGSYVLGDFVQAGTLYDRWTARVEVATQNEDDFVKNLVTIRAESRLALAVTQPAALRRGTFTA